MKNQINHQSLPPSAEVPGHILFDYEKCHLQEKYILSAEYNETCAAKQEELARKANPDTTERFTQSNEPHFLLDGELRTPENWMRRRDNFLLRAKTLRERAEYFKV
jgi:hypothetical protein